MLGLIVAYSRNRVIGRKGTIPWDIPGDKRRFRELTTGNIVIMGRRTYEDIGHPLPDRINIIVSGSMNIDNEYDNLYITDSLPEAINLACDIRKNNNDNQHEGIAGIPDVYIAGGESLYREAILYADVMYITEVDIEVEGDTYFPEFDNSLFDRNEEECYDGDIPYRFVTYTRMHN